MRSFTEIAHRLRQELTNAILLAAPPQIPTDVVVPTPLTMLPSPDRVADSLRQTPFPAELNSYAQEILAHRFPLLGHTIDTGPEIRWRRDYVSQIETGNDYFRFIPYLDATQAGDHKNIWELNRHQHMVVLAQSWLFTNDQRLLDEIWRQFENWVDANPFQRGINWVSALEVAFRALSWLWVYHLVGAQMRPGLRFRFLESLNQHGKHLETNLSYYFSPNTHLLGEAVALHALGTLLTALPNAQHWRDLGAATVSEQLKRQVREDGGYFEQSTYYHVYALDMFLFHGILASADEVYRAKISLMADYLAAIKGPARELPFIGDDDGGRFFYPFGDRSRFGRATLATCAQWLGRNDLPYGAEDLWPQAAWWLGAATGSGKGDARSRMFPATGIAVMTGGDRHVLVDAGPFGPWGSGHSHSDTLSIVARRGDHEVLIDPGTYTYVGDAADRDWFRGSGAHSTIRINGLDQATPVNPFRWENQPSATVLEWTTSDAEDFLDAQCVAQGFTHRRQVRFLKPDLLLVVDTVSGPAGEHDIEQLWQLGSSDNHARVTVDGDAEMIESRRSPVFGVKNPSTARRVHRRSALPAVFATAIDLGDHPQPVRIEQSAESVKFHTAGTEVVFRP